MREGETPTIRREPAVMPFSWAKVPVVLRAEAEGIRRARRLARTRIDSLRLVEAIRTVIGAEAKLSLRAIRRAEPRGVDDAIGVMLAAPEEKTTSQRFLVELEGALGARIVARAIEQKTGVTDPSRAPSPALAGATAAVVVAVLRKALNGAPLLAIAAGPAHALARDQGAAATTAWLSLSLDHEVFDLRITIPDAALAQDDRSSSAILSQLDRTPIALPIVFATCTTTRADIDALSIGDAFLPGLSLSGPVTLIAARSERGIGGNLASDGRLVIADIEEHPWVMPESPESRTDVLVDAPVIVRVELGTVEMPARAWADLGPGDVISLARKVGDPAILRIGGVEVARGELVQIDGEYGVRILARSKEAT